MRQVPNNRILLIGDGKLASHWGHFLALQKIPFRQWARSQSDIGSLKKTLSDSDTLFLAISDRSLPFFYKEHLLKFSKAIYHFSGSFFHPNMVGAHPLMTFGPRLYDLSAYSKIPFIFDHQGPFEFFKDFPNPQFSISKDKKALYHSLCTINANFPQILWQLTIKKFQELGLPQSIAFPIMSQTLMNSLENPEAALTGPLSRGDGITLQSHIEALSDSPEGELYKAFVKYYETKKSTSEALHECS